MDHFSILMFTEIAIDTRSHKAKYNHVNNDLHEIVISTYINRNKLYKQDQHKSI